MTDPADRRLEELMHTLARGVQVPVVPTEDDVRRGRRRLLRMRLAAAGATTGTLAVVLGLTTLTAGDPTATEPPAVNQPSSTSLPASPDSSAPGQGGGSDDRGRGLGGGKAEVQSDPGTTGGDTSVAGRLPVGEGSGSTQTGTDPATPGGTSTQGDHPTRAPSQAPTIEPTASAPTQLPTETPSASPSSTPTDLPTGSPTTTPTVPPTDGPVRVHRVLRYYNDVLAEHLDPDRASLQAYDRTQDPKMTSRAGGLLFALGSTYRWADGDSVAGLGVAVASGWDQVDWECGASYSDWECRTAEDVELASHDGVRQVAAERADGQVVVLTADRSVDSTDEDLAAAVTDDRLVLPGDAPVSPPPIDADDFASAGAAALVRTGESFDQTGIDRTPEVRGTWYVGDTSRGTVSWSVEPVYSGGGWTCLRAYRTCEDVVDESGSTVHVAALRKRAGGGWVIAHAGPSYVVRVFAKDRKFPKKRVYGFVTAEAWQPVR